MEPHRTSSSSAETTTTYKSLSRSNRREADVEVEYDDSNDDDDDGGIEVIDLRPQPLLKREIGEGGVGTSAANIDLEISSSSSSSSSRSSGGSNGDGIRPSVLKTVTGYIIATEFCERLAYYGFSGSLVLFFTKMGYSNADADIQYSVWSSVCYLTPLLGGWLADSVLNRYRTIVLFSSVYVFGLCLVLLSIWPSSSSSSSTGFNVNGTTFFIGMYIIAIGTGGIKPNVSTLGADQFDDRYQQDRVEKESYFNYFYWSVNLGALVSYSVVSYLCQVYSFFVGYAVPTVAMAIAIAVFMVGKRKYTIKEPKGSIVMNAVSIFAYACLKSAVVKIRGGSDRLALMEHVDEDGGAGAGVGVGGDSRHGMVGYDSDCPHSSSNSNSDSNSSSGRVVRSSLTWLDRAQIQYGGKYSQHAVEGVKDIYTLFPFLLSMVAFWGIYNTMSTTFQNQGCQMTTSISSDDSSSRSSSGSSSSSKYNIPISTLNVFDTFVIILLVPIFDKYLYPYCERKGILLTSLRKIGLGLIFALFAMLVAAIVEQSRVSSAPYYQGDYVTIVRQMQGCPIDSSVSPAASSASSLASHILSAPILHSSPFSLSSDSTIAVNCSNSGSFINYDSNLIAISMCQSIYDYNPFEYQLYKSGLNAIEPSNCRQVCSELAPDNSLSLDCIQCDSIPLRSSLHVLWQIPQYSLIGISEIFASIASMEFFYSQSPTSMRSVTSSLNLLTTSLGSLITVPLVLFANTIPSRPWLPSDLDMGHLDYYFFLLAFLMLLDFLYFLYISKNYNYKDHETNWE